MNKFLSKLMSIAAVFLLLTGTEKAQVATGGNFKLEQSVIAGGGGTSAGAANTYSLSGTIGQSAAGAEMSAAPYAQFGGFWTALASAGQVEAPAISKSFSPTSVNVGEVSTLTITLTNPSANTVVLSGVGVTDAFPTGLQVAAIPTAINTCGGTFSAAADATSIALNGGAISVNSSCFVSVKVKATTAGEKINTTGAVSSTNGGTGGTATATLTVNQSAETYSLSGTVTYGITTINQTSPPVSGVNINAAGSSALSAISNLSGAYQLSGLTAGGNYTVIPSKTGEVKGINSLDATRIQQHMVGLITLTPNQLIAADTDNSGTVNSLDATRIQQFLVGIQSPNIVGQWKFAPASRQYNSLNGNIAGQDYQAVLVGEVSGNWADASAFAENETKEEMLLPTIADQSKISTRFENELSEQIAERTEQSNNLQSDALVADLSQTESAALGSGRAVTLPANAKAVSGSTIAIPVTIAALKSEASIESFDFSVFYDRTVLQPADSVGANAGTLSANCSVLANSAVPGRMIVSSACAQSITTGSGTLYNLMFTVIGEGNQSTGLSFANPANGTNTFQFNNGTTSANTIDGRFTVVGSIAASVTVSGKVTNLLGRGIGNVQVTLTDSQGRERTTQTTSSGYYHFDNVEAGETVMISAKAKRFRFNQSSTVRTTNQSVTDADFISE